MTKTTEQRQTNGTIEDRRIAPKDWRVWAIVLLVVCVLVGGGAAWVAFTAVDSNRTVNRATAFRLCSRNQVDRASVHGLLRGLQVDGVITPRRPPAQRALGVEISRALMDPAFLPILDCKPNLTGHGARTIPISEQVDFVERWAEGNLSNPERGICPGSRIGEPALTNC